MVSLQDGDKRDDAEYSLEAIRRLAEFGQIEYRGQKVARDIREIGFELDDVALCLQTLQAHHFKHAVWYSSVRRWHDVYCRAYRAPNGRDFELYIKLRLDQKCVVIELCSFHE